MEMGNNDSAKSIYKKLVELDPNEGFNKYMCLAQLSQELEAVEFYQKGIEIMLRAHEKQTREQANGPGTSGAFAGDDGDDDEADDGEQERDYACSYYGYDNDDAATQRR